MPEKLRDAFLDRYGHLALGALPTRWQVSAVCLRCAHRGEVPVRYLIESRQVHATTRLEDLPRMLRCARCDCRRAARRATPRWCRYRGGGDGRLDTTLSGHRSCPSAQPTSTQQT